MWFKFGKSVLKSHIVKGRSIILWKSFGIIWMKLWYCKQIPQQTHSI